MLKNSPLNNLQKRVTNHSARKTLILQNQILFPLLAIETKQD